MIQYEGTNYAGWQIQKNATTVQEIIINAIEIIIKDKVNLIGSGRTDAGVHALGQVANFKTEDTIDVFKFQHSLNAILPKDISVLKTENVPVEFHSRFDAKRRSYIYLISKMKSPFYSNYSYYYHHKINCTVLNELSKGLPGKKDFTSFARQNTDTKNKICNIYEAYWKERGSLVFFKIEADRFLHGMVRTIVGTLLNIAKGNSTESIENIFEVKKRSAAGEAAPAKGLFLYKVKY